MKPLPRLSRYSGEPEDQPSDSAAEALSAMDRERNRMPSVGRRIFVHILAAALFGAAAVATVIFGSGGSATLQTDRVSVSKVSIESFVEVVPVSASVIPEQTVFLDSVEGGRVIAVQAEAGQRVNAGVPLVTLKNTNLELQVMAREAQFTEQLSNLARAQIEFDRTSLAYEQQLGAARLQIELTDADLNRRRNPQQTGTPQALIDTLETQLVHHRRNHRLVEQARNSDRRNSLHNLAQLQESVSRMKDSLNLLRANLDGLAVSAPITGQVSVLNVEIGQVLAPGQRIGQIDHLGDYRVRARVDEFYLDRLAIGLSAISTISGTETRLVVKKIYPSIEDRQFDVDLAFVGTAPNSARVGQTVRLQINLGDPEHLTTIPNGAYLEDTNGQWVFVFHGASVTATRREITLGRRNARMVEVLTGLSPDERVLTSGYAEVLDKDRISLN